MKRILAARRRTSTARKATFITTRETLLAVSRETLSNTVTPAALRESEFGAGTTLSTAGIALGGFLRILLGFKRILDHKRERSSKFVFLKRGDTTLMQKDAGCYRFVAYPREFAMIMGNTSGHA